MSTHDAEYFRQLRRAQGSPARDPFSAPKFLQRATELRRLERLPWPRHLFGVPASIAELLAEAAQLSEQASENVDAVCPCGCRREHKLNVSQTLRNPYGRGFDVIYFWSDACKSKWNHERPRRPALPVKPARGRSARPLPRIAAFEANPSNGDQYERTQDTATCLV